MSSFRTLDDMDLDGKRVLVRVDLNVPMADGSVTGTTRIERILPTIREIVRNNGKVILLAHFGRPKGARVADMSLKPVVRPLSELLGQAVDFAQDCVGEAASDAVAKMVPGGVLLLENTRYHAGEEKNDGDFAKALAANGDIFNMGGQGKIKFILIEDLTLHLVQLNTQSTGCMFNIRLDFQHKIFDYWLSQTE